MRDRFPLLVVAALLLFAAAGSYLFRGAQRGSFADPLSTWRSEPDGARALYLLASESGLAVGRSQTDLEVPAAGAGYVLLSTWAEETRASQGDLSRGEAKDGGSAEDGDWEVDWRGMNALTAPRLSEDERQALLDHVALGNTLLYVPVGDPKDALLDALGVTLVPVEQDSPGVRTLVPTGPSPWTLGVAHAGAKVSTNLELPEGASPLLVDEQSGGFVAAVIPWQKGQVVVLSAPELAMNERLAQADNAQLWLSLLRTASRSGKALFDEYHHGFSNDRSIAEFARRYGLQFAILQLLFGLCLWTLALRRFGRPQVPEEAERVGSTDVLSAASRIYREGRHYRFAAELISRGLLQQLAQHAALPFRARPEEVAQALRARHEPELAQALEKVVELSGRASSEHDVLETASLAAQTRSTSPLSKVRKTP